MTNLPMPIAVTPTVALHGAPVPALVAGRRRTRQRPVPRILRCHIRNPHTRRAYYRAAEEFLAWCAEADRRRPAPARRGFNILSTDVPLFQTSTTTVSVACWRAARRSSCERRRVALLAKGWPLNRKREACHHEEFSLADRSTSTFHR
jgi:hypothetical protein